MISYEQGPLKQTQQKEIEKNDLSEDLVFLTRTGDDPGESVPFSTHTPLLLWTPGFYGGDSHDFDAVWCNVNSSQESMILEVLIRVVINEGWEDAPW